MSSASCTACCSVLLAAASLEDNLFPWRLFFAGSIFRLSSSSFEMAPKARFWRYEQSLPISKRGWKTSP